MKTRILIVEDEKKQTDRIIKCLLKHGITSNNIKQAKSFEKAKEKLETAIWDFVVLDVNILEHEDDQPDSAIKKNSERLMEYIRNENEKRPDSKIKVIYSTGSKEHILYKEVYKGQEWVLNVIEKQASNEYEDALIGTIQKELATPRGTSAVIEYTGIPKDVVIKLKHLDKGRFAAIDNIQQLYTQGDYFQVIMLCGSFVEDIIARFDSNLITIKDDVPENIYAALNSLRGQKKEKDGQFSKWVVNDLAEKKISQKSIEYAILAYKCRNHAAHPSSPMCGRHKQDFNMYYNDPEKYTIHTAAISIQLLVPIIIDYIKYME
jgi:CheY-like chemotaxis protein